MKGNLSAVIGSIILALAVVISLGIDLHDVSRSGSKDLRNRITGVRLLAHHLDPYHYKWQEGDPEQYLDPDDNPFLAVTRTTVTPAMLFLHLPLAGLPYRPTQFIWFMIEWLLLLGTGLFWLRHLRTPYQRWLLAFFIVGYTYTAAWRLHAEQGQAYVLLLFLFGGWLSLTLDSPQRFSFLTGALAGLLMTLRPPFLMIAPFLLLHRRGQLLGAAVGFALGFGLPLLINPAAWLDYASAMHVYEQGFSIMGQGTIVAIEPAPFTIEGIPTSTLIHNSPIPLGDFSAYHFVYQTFHHFFPASLLILVVAVPFPVWLWLTRKHPVEIVLAGLAAWIFMADFVLPAVRISYNDVQALNLAALALLVYARCPMAAWFCGAALFVGWSVTGLAPSIHGLSNLSTLCWVIAALFLLATTGSWPPCGRLRRKPDLLKKS